MEEYLLNLSFLSIINMDKNQQIISSGGGFYLNFKDHIYFVTVKHVAEPDVLSYLEIKYEASGGSKLKPLENLNYAIKTTMNPDSKFNVIDIAFADITENFEEYKAFFQEIIADRFPPIINNEEEKIILSISEKQLNNHDVYIFAGLTRPQIETPPIPHYVYQRTLTIERVLFKSNHTADSNLLIFTPINGHRGHDVYRGCSGTPLLDNNGAVRAVILSGSDELNEIYAYDINKIKLLLQADFIASNFSK